jgi:WD40 repeat protein
MTISIECDLCGKKYKLNDSLAGKKLTCKECGSSIRVPNGDDDDDDDFDDAPVAPRKKAAAPARRKKKSGGSNAGLIIGLVAGGGVALLGIVGLVIAFAFGRSSPPPIGNVGGPTPPPMVPGMNPGTTPSTAAGTTTPSKPAEPIVTFGAPSGWKAAPDPSPNAAPAPFANDVAIPLQSKYTMDGRFITYGAGSSPFVMVGDTQNNDVPHELWNLATNQVVAKMSGVKTTASSYYSLGADGRFVVWWGWGNDLNVYDFQAGKELPKIPGPTGDDKFYPSYCFLAGNDKIVGFAISQKLMKVWQLPEGKLLSTVKLGDQWGMAERGSVSPGGKYVAVLDHITERVIKLYDTATGAAAGEIRPTSKSYAEMKQLAFSPDGQQLAALLEGSRSTGIVFFNLSDGKQTDLIEIAPAITTSMDTEYAAQGLAWFPDGKKLLVHDMAVVDRAKRTLVYTFPKPTLRARVRKPISGERVALYEGNDKKGTIKTIPLTDAELNKATTIAEAGGLPEDVPLPKLTKASLAAAQKPAAPGAWKVTPDAAAPLAADAGTKPLPISDNGGGTRELALSGGSAPRAFLRIVEDEAVKAVDFSYPDTKYVTLDGVMQTITRPKPISVGKNRIDVYDLASGEAKGSIAIPFGMSLHNASLDGSRVLVEAHGAKGRLDVYAADGQHVVGFRPYTGVKNEPELELHEAALVDAETVVTRNYGRDLAVWALPACQPRWTIPKVTSFAASPGGKYLACGTPTGVELRDLRTGEGLGQVPFKGTVKLLAFHPAGERLAVYLEDGAGRFHYVVDLKTGAIGDEMPAPTAGNALQWAGDQQLLIGSSYRSESARTTNMMLFDLTYRTNAWSYALLNGNWSPINFDTRCWVASPKSERVAQTMLQGVTLPDPAAAKTLAGAKLEPELVLKPGSTVSLSVQIGATPWQSDLPQQLEALVRQGIEKSGVTIATTTQPVHIEVVGKPTTGQKFEVSKLGSLTDKHQVQSYSMQLSIIYKFSNGHVWQNHLDAANATGFGIKRIDASKPIQQAYDEDLTSRLKTHLQSLGFPTHLFSPKSSSGLGRTTLWGDGPQPAKP